MENPVSLLKLYHFILQLHHVTNLEQINAQERHRVMQKLACRGSLEMWCNSVQFNYSYVINVSQFYQSYIYLITEYDYTLWHYCVYTLLVISTLSGVTEPTGVVKSLCVVYLAVIWSCEITVCCISCSDLVLFTVQGNSSKGQ